MKLEYTVNKVNLVAGLTYFGLNTRKSKIFRFISFYVYPVIFAFIAFTEFQKNGFSMPAIFMMAGVIFLPLYQLFFKKLRFKSYFEKYVDKKLEFALGKQEVLEVEGSFIKSQNSMGESKLSLDALKSLTEVKEYYFLKVKNETFFVLPKEELNDFELNNFIEKILERTDIPVIQDPKWKL